MRLVIEITRMRICTTNSLHALMSPYPDQILEDLRNRSFASFLDCTRWIAAMVVLLGHLRNPLFFGYENVASADRTPLVQLWYFVTGLHGHAVIVFFVLSGYLVGGIASARAHTGRFDFPAYAIDRISRLYVAFLPALLLTAVLDISGSIWFADTGFWTHAHPMIKEKIDSESFLTFLNPGTFFANVFMLQTIKSAPFGSNGPLWTISLEFWFYAVFGLGLLGYLASTRHKQVLAGLGVVLLTVLLGAQFPGYMGLWLLGVLAGFIPWRSLERPVLAAGVFLCILAVTRMFQELLEQLSWGRWLRDYLVAGSFAWLLVSMRKRSFSLFSMTRRFNRFMADFSYSLYLIHFPLMLFLLGMLHATGRFDGIARGYSPTSPEGLFVYLIVATATCVSAWVFSRATERRTPTVRSFLKRVASVNIRNRANPSR